MGNPAQGRAGRAVVARSAFPTTNFAEITAANENDPDSQPGEGPLGPGNPPNQDDESSVTVTLSADLSLTKVESAGDYIAGNLPAGEFRVDVVQSTLPSGAANVVDPDGANDSTSRLALAGGASNLDQNFGYTLPAAASPPSVPLPFTGASMAGRAAVLGMMLLVTGLALAVGARRNGVLSALLARRRAAGAI